MQATLMTWQETEYSNLEGHFMATDLKYHYEQQITIPINSQRAMYN